MRLLRGSLWTTLGFFQIINNNPTGAQIKLTREHFVSKFSYNFFSFKVARYSPCAAFKTTPVRVLRQCLNFCVISQMYCYWKLEKCHPNDKMFRQAWEIFDHQCQQYLTMSKICKTNAKPRGKSECFYYTQWHFGLTFFMPAQCAKGWFRTCFVLLNRFHNTLYTSQWHDCTLSRITDL